MVLLLSVHHNRCSDYSAATFSYIWVSTLCAFLLLRVVTNRINVNVNCVD